MRRRRLRWGAGSSEAVSSSGGSGRLGADWRVGASPGRLRCNLGCSLGSRAPVPLLPLPFSSSRLPSSACEPPWQRRRPERLCSARCSSPGERAASSAAAAAGWSARAGQEHPQRKTPGGSAWWSRGSPAESRVRRGFFSVIFFFFWLPGAWAGARCPEYSSSCWLQMGCEVCSGRREPAERVGETFHLVKFLPRHGFEPPSPPGGEGDSALRR